MLRAGMIEHHVQHDVDPGSFKFLRQLFKISHRSKPRIDLPIISHIIAVVILRRHKEWVEPDHIDVQCLEIIDLFNDAA